MSDNTERTVWGSKLGFILAAVGSAVGLGNIWRFSYLAYKNGGGAFLIPYAIALLLVGIPIMILEYTLGHREKGSAPLTFARINKKWEWIGWWMPTVATFGILLFYSVVIGWCINYLYFSFSLAWGDAPESFFYKTFLHISSGPLDLGGINWQIAFATAIAWLISWAICYKEVNHGIEKACMIFIPMLFFLTAILVCWSLSLDGAREGIRHYLTPDWSKINIITHFNDSAVWETWLSAFGQIFFDLSLGFGIMITYASYLPKKTNIVGNAFATSLTNCAYSFFAGFAVFGTLGFMAAKQGLPIDQVVKSGPGLAFIVYPEAIANLPYGRNLFGVTFFLTLVIAGLSSAVSLVEAFACSVTDKFAIPRGRVVTGICTLGFLMSLIFTTNAGLYILDIVDHFVNNYGLIIGGFLECIFVGYVLKARIARHHVNRQGAIRLSALWEICIKYITPAMLGVIIIKAFIGDISNHYEGYATKALVLYGIGMLILTIAIAIYLAAQSWSNTKHFHKPEEDHLLT